MKSISTMAALVLLGACGQFSEASFNVEVLDANKALTLVVANQNRSATIQEASLLLQNGVLEGSEVVTELFQNEVVDIDLGENGFAILNKEVIESDELYNIFKVTIQDVDFTITADLVGNNDGIEESNIFVSLQNLNIELVFENLGMNLIDNNLEAVLQIDPSLLFDGIDLNAQFVAQNVQADTVMQLNVDQTPDEIALIQQNLLDQTKNVVNFVYNVKVQAEPVDED